MVNEAEYRIGTEDFIVLVLVRACLYELSPRIQNLAFSSDPRRIYLHFRFSEYGPAEVIGVDSIIAEIEATIADFRLEVKYSIDIGLSGTEWHWKGCREVIAMHPQEPVSA